MQKFAAMRHSAQRFAMQFFNISNIYINLKEKTMSTNTTNGNTSSTSNGGLLQGALPAMENVAKHADEALQNGIKSVRESTENLRQQARHANEAAIGYVRQEPVKSVLFGVAAGALLVTMLSMLSRKNRS
jgi:ElaB/YqjD/DUF883 family membrane-anchored ribosome-binding protein